MNKTKQWDSVWKTKKINSDYSLKLYNFLATIGEGLCPTSKVLEVGCGSGQGLKNFPKSIAVGLDISKEALKLARNHNNNLVLADIFTSPFKRGTFDFTFNSGVVEHYKHPENIEIVSEMSRVTKRSGKVMVIVPNSFCIWYRVYKKMSLSMGRFKFGYEEDYSIGRLKAIVLSVSLSIEKVFGLQALIPFATDEFELLPENIRRYFGILERAIPYKQYYGYAIGVICTNS